MLPPILHRNIVVYSVCRYPNYDNLNTLYLFLSYLSLFQFFKKISDSIYTRQFLDQNLCPPTMVQSVSPNAQGKTISIWVSILDFGLWTFN